MSSKRFKKLLEEAEMSVGKTYYSLTVVRVASRAGDYSPRSSPFLVCQCKCGKYILLNFIGVVKGRLRGCGCKFNMTKHGCKNKKIYHTWQGLVQRCTNTKNKYYHNYGGRGIKVCDEWLVKGSGFISFKNWAEQNGYREDLEIDRENNDGNYCPENCRWVTKKENLINRRGVKIFTYNGVTTSFRSLVSRFGVVNYEAAQYRLNAGWKLEEILTIPKNGNRSAVC